MLKKQYCEWCKILCDNPLEYSWGVEGPNVTNRINRFYGLSWKERLRSIVYFSPHQKVLILAEIIAGPVESQLLICLLLLCNSILRIWFFKIYRLLQFLSYHLEAFRNCVENFDLGFKPNLQLHYYYYRLKPHINQLWFRFAILL